MLIAFQQNNSGNGAVPDPSSSCEGAAPQDYEFTRKCLELASDKMKSWSVVSTMTSGWGCRVAACSTKEERYFTQALSAMARSLRGYEMHK